MNSTLSEAIDAYGDTGFTEHFAVRNRKLCGLDSGASFETHDVVIREFARFEGVSDPDDMSIVYAIESRTGLRGTLTDAFGVYSSPAISEFLDGVAIRRSAGAGRAADESTGVSAGRVTVGR